MNLSVGELSMCLPSESSQGSLFIMMVTHKLALVGASCVSLSLHLALCQPHQPVHSCCPSRVQASLPSVFCQLTVLVTGIMPAHTLVWQSY